ncbi:MAG: hypothetical protein PHT60_14765 [Acidiphilium sp.]|nr:hypothetical protein [Acidiphilium sp.]MDD4937024.1 hypothetical protein [Acidiphilium sp.]
MELKPGKSELNAGVGNTAGGWSTEAKLVGHDAVLFWRPFLIGAVLALVLAAGLLAIAIAAGILPETVRVGFARTVNSPFFLDVVSTLGAAFAGTSGAQFLAERTARRREALAELHSTNAAIGFAFNIANTYRATKKQFVRDHTTNYAKLRAKWMTHVAAVAEGERLGTTFSYSVELRTISVPFSPIEQLQKVMTENISPGRALLILTPLIQSIQGFADTVAQRNAWIDEIKHLPDNIEEKRAHLYFGTPFASRRTDDRYPNLIQALSEQTDDCIAFSILVSEALQKYGERLAAQYGRGAPRIAAPQFDQAGDLLPHMSRYSNFIS